MGETPMEALKQVAKTIPGITPLFRGLRRLYLERVLGIYVNEYVFTNICKQNGWKGKDSVSGPGSDLGATQVIRERLPQFLREFGITSILDIPCGDFCWMSKVDLTGVQYIGADIVEDLVQKNADTYNDRKLQFRHLNLVADPLPKVDLILCRDCLVHFPYEDIFPALRNIVKSGSKYFLTTTFRANTANRDVPVGGWRMLNLEIVPFQFPEPLWLIDEEYTANDNAYRDKSLGLWQIEDIKGCLER
jgi:SAM-dependent methyltransferase